MIADLLSFAGFGGILIGLVVVGGVIFCVATSADDPSGISGFLRRKQVKARPRRGER